MEFEERKMQLELKSLRLEQETDRTDDDEEGKRFRKRLDELLSEEQDPLTSLISLTEKMTCYGCYGS